MKVHGKLILHDTDRDTGEVSHIGTIRRHKIGWRFDPAADWCFNASQLARVTALLEALNEPR
jgi:hypothetical protein